MRVCTTRAFALLVTIAIVLIVGTPVDAQDRSQDRIYVDQYMVLRSELMIAGADGSNPQKLVPGPQIDYNASFSFDGQWVVFTSERTGSADIYRVRVDGTGLERLTDSPAFDDQAALSPDGGSMAFVSSRGDGTTDIHILDLESRQIRNLTNSPGGDFRPSWSPDGQTIAFSSDRGTGLPHQGYPGPAGKWEHVQAASVYLKALGLDKLQQYEQAQTAYGTFLAMKPDMQDEVWKAEQRLKTIEKVLAKR